MLLPLRSFSLPRFRSLLSPAKCRHPSPPPVSTLHSPFLSPLSCFNFSHTSSMMGISASGTSRCIQDSTVAMRSLDRLPSHTRCQTARHARVYSKQRTRTRHQCRERSVFPFAIIITQSFRSSIFTFTHTDTHGAPTGVWEE